MQRRRLIFEENKSLVRFSFLIDVEAFYSFYIDSETPMLRNFHLPVEFFLIFSFKDKTCWIIIQCIQSTSMAMVFCTPRDHYQIYILNCHSSLIFQPICLKFGVHVLQYKVYDFNIPTRVKNVPDDLIDLCLITTAT